MKLFRITSTELPELYVFAHGERDAVEIYRSFKMLLEWNHGPFEIEHVDRQVGWKQNRTLKRLLKAGTRGVHPGTQTLLFPPLSFCQLARPLMRFSRRPTYQNDW